MLLHLATHHRGPRGAFLFGLKTAGLAALVAALALAASFRPAQAQSTVTAILDWTAPGDDGNTGRASQYQMRYRSAAISGTDTLGWWNAATAVSGLPTPGTAGSTQSVQVSGLDPSLTWYFVLRTADEVPNWSFYSNVAVRPPGTPADTTPPAAISDLGVGAAAPATPALPASQRSFGRR